MKFSLSLAGLLAALVLGVLAAPLEPRDDTKAQTLRLKDVRKFADNGLYGPKETFNKIENAVEFCRKELMGSIPALSPSKPYFEAQTSLKASSTACAKFLMQVLEGPIGAALHIHFNAILPFETAWKIANKKGSIKEISKQDVITKSEQKAIQISNPKQFQKGGKPVLITEQNEKEIMAEFRKQIILEPDWQKKLGERGQEMWTKFNDMGTFYWKYFTMYEQALRDYTTQVIQTGLKQGIYYQEWKTMMLAEGILYKAEGTAVDSKTYLEIVSDVIRKQKEENPKFVGAKIIWCQPRAQGLVKFATSVTDMIDYRKEKEWAKLIAGFDIVGEEDRKGFNPNRHYDEQIQEVIKSAKERDLKDYPFGLPFHTGEATEKSGNAWDNIKYLEELATANKGNGIQFRGGHTVLLSKDDGMRRKYNDLNIHSELCPISNNVLGTNNNAGDWKNIYDPIIKTNSASLNGDDPTYQRSTPADEVLFGWRGGMNFLEMIAVGEMSINSGIMTAAERAKALEHFRADWKALVGKIVIPPGHGESTASGRS